MDFMELHGFSSLLVDVVWTFVEFDVLSRVFQKLREFS